MFCITLIISFCFYKFISFDIFIRLCTIFLRSNSLTIFIDVLCNYSWCRSSLLLVDMFCITLIISFCFYKFISFDIFFVFCSIFLWSNSFSIFINVFCYYFSIWCKYPCSFYVFVFVCNFYFIIVIRFECPSSLVCFISKCSVIACWYWGCYCVTFYFVCYFCWCFCF